MFCLSVVFLVFFVIVCVLVCLLSGFLFFIFLVICECDLLCECVKWEILRKRFDHTTGPASISGSGAEEVVQGWRPREGGVRSLRGRDRADRQDREQPGYPLLGPHHARSTVYNLSLSLSLSLCHSHSVTRTLFLFLMYC